MRLFFIFFLFGHGLFHALGFMRVFDAGGFGDPIPTELGLFWLVACILYLATGYGFALRFRRWWMAGFTAVVVSQALVIVEWNVTAWGTLPNAFVFLICLISYRNWKFEIEAKRKADGLRIKAMNQKFGFQEPRTLPDCVKKWIEWSGASEARPPTSVNIEQTGKMRLKENAPWIPFRARQWFSLSDPGFVWLAKVGEGKFLQFMGRDTYLEEKGNMLIKAFGFLGVADASGPEMDQGAAIRFLSEMIWFPQMVFSDKLEWEGTGLYSAKVRIKNHIDREGKFYFEENGRPSAFEALRHNSETGKREVWRIEIEESGVLEEEGIRIPSRAKVIWKLETGDFHWLSLELESVLFMHRDPKRSGEKQLEPIPSKVNW